LSIVHKTQNTTFYSVRKFQDVLNLDILLKGSPILTVEYLSKIVIEIGKYKLGKEGGGRET
jgi:hypothetical protein